MFPFPGKRTVSFCSQTVAALLFCIARSRRKWFSAKGRTARSWNAHRFPILELRPVSYTSQCVCVQRGPFYRLHAMPPHRQSVACQPPSCMKCGPWPRQSSFQAPGRQRIRSSERLPWGGSKVLAELLKGICQRRYMVRRQAPHFALSRPSCSLSMPLKSGRCAQYITNV